MFLYVCTSTHLKALTTHIYYKNSAYEIGDMIDENRALVDTGTYEKATSTINKQEWVNVLR